MLNPSAHVFLAIFYIYWNLHKIFDAQIQPILLYRSELWGLDDMSIIESVHIFSLKKILKKAL